MQRESISIENCLANHSFQNWLVSNYILFRYNITKEALVFKENSIGGTKTAERIVNILWENAGFLVSTLEIARQIYGIADQSEINAITAWADQIRKRKLSNAELLFNAKGIGWAVGVSKLGLSEKSLLVTFRLWQDMLKPVDEKIIALNVYGFDDDSAIASVRRQTEKLRFRELPQTTARIEMENNPAGRKYVLTSKYQQQKQKRVNSKKTNSQDLSSDFQDWLSSPKIRIIKTFFDESEETSIPLNLNLKSHVLLQTLQNNRKYLLSFEYLSNVIYGKIDETAKVKELLSYLKDNKLLISYRVLVLENFGVGLDIADVVITAKQLELLQMLWTKSFTLKEITEALYQQDNEVTRNRTFSVISKTRKVLNPIGHDIMVKKEGDKKVYAFTTSNPVE